MEWKRETRAVDMLKENEKNPRQMSREEERQLRKSLDEFGQCQPLVINTDNTVIGGHQRLQILRDMGVKYVDVYVPMQPLTNRQVDELNIRLNRNSGQWCWDTLANSWEIDDLLEWGFEEADLGLDAAEKPKKQPKPQISIEFEDRDTMMEWLPKFETIASETFSKLKVRG